MKKLIKKSFEHLGYKIFSVSQPDQLLNFIQNDAFEMQKRLVKDPNSHLTIFDVGAFKGDVALQYNSSFPDCRIFCFEPFPDSFLKLKQNTSSFDNIIAVNSGIGGENGKTKFHSNNLPQTNSLLSSDQGGGKVWGEGLLDTIETVEVDIVTLDHFIETNEIKKIDILKLDVQGSEYLVLEGAKNAIKKGIVQMIYTEIITLPTYKGQKEMDEVLAMYRLNGFDLFNLYNYSLTNDGRLRQVDAIFIKSK